MLLLSDLDRTLIPNGAQPESEQARSLFRRLASRPEVTLAYVSGRDLALVEAAVAEYGLPQPDYAVCDVGTTVYRRRPDGWTEAAEWTESLQAVFSASLRDKLLRAISPLPGLVLQEKEKQGPFKLSFYWNPDQGSPDAAVAEALLRIKAEVKVVVSLDEMKNKGLLDLLPANAGKLEAARFLARRLGMDLSRTVFAGDSGNDLEVLASEIPAVLVANATAEVRQRAVALAEAAGTRDRLYLARGGFMGMNGNYSAGVIEGLAHFIPETGEWLEGA